MVDSACSTPQQFSTPLSTNQLPSQPTGKRTWYSSMQRQNTREPRYLPAIQRSIYEETSSAHTLRDTPWRSRPYYGCRTIAILDPVVDFYSDFWEVDHLANRTAGNVIQHCKAHFSRYGIPDVLVSDNAGKFGSNEFNNFATEWEFKHATSSPYHSQSNGKSESAVKIAKKLLKKTKRDGQDMWKAILDWRNTPSEGMESSPVQRLMSCRTRTSLPTATELLAPQVIEGVPEKIKLKLKKAKLYHDRKTKELPELKVGERV